MLMNALIIFAQHRLPSRYTAGRITVPTVASTHLQGAVEEHPFLHIF